MASMPRTAFVLQILRGDTSAQEAAREEDLTPGIRYDHEHDRSFRADAWLSYYVKQKVFAPTGIEFFYCWPK